MNLYSWKSKLPDNFDSLQHQEKSNPFKGLGSDEGKQADKRDLDETRSLRKEHLYDNSNPVV